MSDEEYIIRKYFIVEQKNGSMVRKFQRDVTPLSEFNPDFFSFCEEKAKENTTNNAIFVDKVSYYKNLSPVTSAYGIFRPRAGLLMQYQGCAEVLKKQSP